MTLALPFAVLAAAACAAFVTRKRVALVAPLSLGAVATAFALVATTPAGTTDTLLDVGLRLSPLTRTTALVLLAIVLLLIVDVWLGEPAYNFFPTALGVAAAVVAVMTLVEPLAMYSALLFALLMPVGSFIFQIHRNRTVEAALRHFAFVILGGSLGMASLALAAGLPRDQPADTFVLLCVLLFVAFALKLAAIPFHTHAALLAAEAPAAALALYFGVLAPATFVAFAEILTLSGLLPAIVQVAKVQEVLIGIGLVSAVGGALLAIGAPDLRRLVVYSVTSNLGAALVGLATLSGPGIVGAIVIVLVTGASATQQLLAAGAIERRARNGARPRAADAPLAAAAFAAGAIGMIGAPPLVGFPGRFFVQLIAYAFSGAVGTALVLATLGLLIAQLRAIVGLFGTPIDSWRGERRPVAAAVGAVIFGALLIGGVSPDAFLAPIAAFADEFLRALRPL